LVRACGTEGHARRTVHRDQTRNGVPEQATPYNCHPLPDSAPHN
jgi:hypothetical protein